MADSNSTSSFYVYLHLRATDGRVFYVGKGSKNRAFSKGGRSIFWKKIVKKHSYTVDIVQNNLQEWYAFELEKELIAYYGRENLCNLTDGGDGGLAGFKKSQESKQKHSNAMKGIKNPNFGMSEKFSGIKNPMFGKKHSEVRNKLVSEKLKGRKTANAKTTICSNGMIFESTRKASFWLRNNNHPKAKSTAISECCNSKRKTAYGYKWSFKNADC